MKTSSASIFDSLHHHPKLAAGAAANKPASSSSSSSAATSTGNQPSQQQQQLVPMSPAKIKTQSVLCTQDLFVCLLLKYAINLIKSTSQVGGGQNGSGGSNGRLTKPGGGKRGQQANAVYRKYNAILEEESEELIDEFYENEVVTDEDEEGLEEQEEDEDEMDDDDDMDENHDVDSTDVDETTDVESDHHVEDSASHVTTTTTNSKLLATLSNACLELLIESLALCQSSALAMVISNSGYPIELTVSDVRTSGDGLFLLLKTIGACAPLRLVEPCYAYLAKIRRLSEPLLWLLAGLFNDARFVDAFIHKRNGLEIISKGKLKNHNFFLFLYLSSSPVHSKFQVKNDSRFKFCIYVNVRSIVLAELTF
jgi:hypothetical protein